MLSLFYLSVIVLLYPFMGYPALLSFFSLLFGKKPDSREICPSVSLLISAYNEQDIIEEKIRNTLELDYPADKLEIIVASESTDRTNEIALKYQSRGVVLHSFSERKGKAATLYRTVPLAKGEIVVFSDANALYAGDSIKKLVRNFNDKEIGCVSGRLTYRNPDGTGAGKSESLYWNYEMAVKQFESRLFSLLGANGSIFAIRKELYFPIDETRGDDFELPVRIALKGYGVILEPEALSFEKATDTVREEFKRKVRMISWNLASAFILLKSAYEERKPLLLFQLVSHKIIRWFMPAALAGILISSIALGSENDFFKIISVLQGIFYTCAVLGYFMENKTAFGLFNYSYYFCMINWASVIGLYRFISQKEKTVWEKVRN